MLANLLVKITETIWLKFLKQPVSKWEPIPLFMIAICVSMWGFAFFATVLFVTMPHNPEFVGSAIFMQGNSNNNATLLASDFLLALAFEIFSKFGTVMIYTVDGINMFTVIAFVHFWTKRFR